jgi:hypothetical protein
LNRAFVQESTTADEYEEIGVATDADIDYDGELKIYQRAGDTSGDVYSLSAAMPGADDEGAPALWYQWSPEP